jgi:hypothetical protein
MQKTVGHDDIQNDIFPKNTQNNSSWSLYARAGSQSFTGDEMGSTSSGISEMPI